MDNILYATSFTPAYGLTLSSCESKRTVSIGSGLTAIDAVRSRNEFVSATVGGYRKKRYIVEREAIMVIITTYQYMGTLPRMIPVMRLPMI